MSLWKRFFSPLRAPAFGAKKKNPPQRGQFAIYALVAGALGGWAIIAGFSRASKPALSAFGVASMVAAASFLAGTFFGFLFGVPKTLQKSVGDEEGGRVVDPSAKPIYRANTNLEQISDWLTKILVGAGLTQIAAIRRWLNDLGISLAPGFGTSDNARVFAMATVVSYLLNGFLLGYLWTRLYFAGALAQADDVESLAREIKEIREQSDLDAKALALTIKQLNPSAGISAPTQQELNDAIKDASQNVKSQIFYLAQTERQENWAEPSKKAKMERTMPIFRALIACDADEAYHQNHGQLGYVLKDQRVPDWTGAEAALTKAIMIRGSALDHDWVLYEFNRADCRINIDDNFKQGQKSSPDKRKQIIDDLRLASTDDYVAGIMHTNSTINAWIALNDVQERELT
jgi:hypothetical protein